MKMKSTVNLLVVVLMVAAPLLYAAVPRLINYQGYLTDSGGLAINGPHNLTFKIYPDSSQSSQPLWTELHSSVDINGGLFSVILGGTTSIPDSVFAGSPRWLGIAVDSDPEMKPRMMLTSVPWALRAAIADSAISVAGGGSGGGGDITAVYPMDGLWSPDSGDAGDVRLFVLAQPGSGLIVDPVDGVKIEPEGVTGDKIAGGAVTTAKLDSASVTGAKLASEAVSSAALATAAVTNDKLASFAVADTNLRVNSVTTEKLLNGAVNRDKLFNGSVNTAKLDTNAVTSGKIDNATILFEDIAANGATEGQVMKYVGGNWVARDDSVGDGGALDGVWGGTGLTGGGSTGDVTLGVDFGSNGIDTTVARSDHNHDTVYVNVGQDSSVTTGMIVDSNILFIDIAQNGAADGQVIKWSGGLSAWIAANDSVGGGGSGTSGWSDDGTVVRLETGTDSVGIGTASPTEKLDVDGNIRASGKAAFGVGHNNPATFSFVAGQDNTVLGAATTVGGGRNNAARGNYSVVSGGGGPQQSDSNSAGGDFCVVGGGSRNVAGVYDGGPEYSQYATVGGGRYNKARCHYSVVGGGGFNVAGDTLAAPDDGQYAAVGGGYFNLAGGDYSFIGGGGENETGDTGSGSGNEGDYATVVGGRYNQARGRYSVVCGGGGDSGPYSNRALSDYSFVGGGEHNYAGTGAGSESHATVCGGRDNMANDRFAAIVGGEQNSVTGVAGAIGGGSHNTVLGDSSVVCGGAENTATGRYNTIGGGTDNSAWAEYATVGGGSENSAGAAYATVPGGWLNEATGEYSFAAGNNAKARHGGSVVISAWQDPQPGDSVSSGRLEQIVMRARSGFYFTDQSEQAPSSGSRFFDTSTGAWLSDTGSWENSSDRALKENFTDIDGGELLERINNLTVMRWNYRKDDDSVTHIGPVAQDFYSAFGVGYSDRSISSINLGGVSLAAIKELAKRDQAQKTEIEKLKTQVEELQNLVQQLLAEMEETHSGGQD